MRTCSVLDKWWSRGIGFYLEISWLTYFEKATCTFTLPQLKWMETNSSNFDLSVWILWWKKKQQLQAPYGSDIDDFDTWTMIAWECFKKRTWFMIVYYLLIVEMYLKDMQQERLTKKFLTKINLDSFCSFGISSHTYIYADQCIKLLEVTRISWLSLITNQWCFGFIFWRTSKKYLVFSKSSKQW